MRNNKKKIWTVALMCAFTSGCTGVQKNTVTVATDEAYTKQQIVAEHTEAASTQNLSEATTESEEYAEQQLQKVQLILHRCEDVDSLHQDSLSLISELVQ